MSRSKPKAAALRMMVAMAMAACAAAVSPVAAIAADADAACPGAVAWREAHPDASPAAAARRDAARSLRRPELAAELHRRVDADQDARRTMLARRGDGAAARAVEHIDADDVAWLTAELKKNGLPGVDDIGEGGLHLVWLLVQHADRDPPLQQLALRWFEGLHRAGEFSADDLARLTDRVLLQQGHGQRFGTQFDWTSGVFEPRPIDDPAGVDARRRALGLMPLADYACVMDAALARPEP